MAIRATVTMNNNFGDITAEIMQRLVQGENLAAERALALASDRVPFDQGTLSDSGAVDPAKDPETGAVVVYDTPYAARLHEHPEYNFSTDSNPNAQGKWVENAIVENKGELGDIIRNKVSNG